MNCLFVTIGLNSLVHNITSDMKEILKLSRQGWGRAT